MKYDEITKKYFILTRYMSDENGHYGKTIYNEFDNYSEARYFFENLHDVGIGPILFKSVFFIQGQEKHLEKYFVEKEGLTSAKENELFLQSRKRSGFANK